MAQVDHEYHYGLEKITSLFVSFLIPNTVKQISPEIKRRIALLTVISFVGSAALLFFGSLAFIRGAFQLGTIDFLMTAILLGNLLDARLRAQYQYNITIGISLISAFYVYLYLSGGILQTAFVWYYTYPVVAMFLLGSRKGGIAAGVMTLPVLVLMTIEESHPFFAAYKLDFEIRFLGSYIVLGVFTFFIESTAENTRKGIIEINRNLERLVEKRTSELTNEIANHKEVQKQLHQSEKRYRVMFEKSINAIFLVERKTGQYVDCNPAAEELTGRNKSQLLELTTIEVTPDSAQERLAHLNRKDSDLYGDIVTYQQPDGTNKNASFNAIPIDEDLIMGIAQDITELEAAEVEQEKLQARLIQMEKMEVLGTMAGSVAHDLNNILTGVVSYPELIRSTLPEDSSLRAPLKTIEEAGKRAAAVVEDLLTLSRDAVSAQKLTDLHLLIEELLSSPEWGHILISNPNVSLEVRLEASNTKIQCSPVHIRKCLMNLLHNGIEAAAPAGSVTLSTRNEITEENLCGNGGMHVSALGNIVISVADNGSGIADEHIEHIFEPFYTTKKMGRSGTGLGLAITWSTVEQHRGKIKAQNLNTGGALFELALPLVYDDHSEHTTQETPELEHYLGTESILIIDDEPQLREILSHMVARLGYSVVAAATSTEALEFLSNQTFDLIVLDMILENDLSGYEVFKEILASHPKQKAIIITGYSTSVEVKKTLGLGASCMVKKPVVLEDLGKAMKEALV